MSLDAIMTQIAVIEGNITGVKKANDKAPATMNVFPCFVNFPAGGSLVYTPAVRRPKHRITLELHVTKPVVLVADRLMRSYLELVLAAFETHLTLNSTASCSRILDYAYGVLTYNGEQHLGITFTLEVDEIIGITYTN